MKYIPVFYNPRMSAFNNVSMSPSAQKPVQVIASWRSKFHQIKEMPVEPLTAAQISLAHDASFVRQILKLEIMNGFNNRLPSVAKSLRWTNGSMVSAALHAFKHGGVAVSPTSGFHHAGWSSAGGFCTFNGLMIAAQALRLSGAKKVGILDLDMHYGNGTDSIIKKLGLEDSIRHWTFGGESITRDGVEDWLKDLPKIVAKFQDCDVLLYQAGVDPHIDDPLGGVLTTEQMRHRDQIVFETCKRLEIPIAWNLAGGYQTPVRKILDLHDTTMRCCVLAYLTEENANGKKRKTRV